MGSTRELRLSGTLEAERSLALSFATLGTVEQVMVQEGEAVTKGQALARISPRTYEDALGMVKAKADQAEDAYKRLEPMHRNKTLPDVKMVEIETGLQQARLSLNMAKKNLEDTVLRAPEAGIVARRQIEPGMSVAPSIPAIVLVQTRTVLATASVPEKQLARVKKGDTAVVTVPALGKTYKGVVRNIGVMADPLTRTYTVKVAIANPGELRVGMVTDTSLKTETGPGDLVVPSEAVRVDEAGRPFVYIVSADRRLQLRRVEIAGFAGEGTGLSSGVSEGEAVVISGTPMLGDGMAVRTTGQTVEGK
jgi:RND family efflux transporter MFP subunit